MNLPSLPPGDAAIVECVRCGRPLAAFYSGGLVFTDDDRELEEGLLGFVLTTFVLQDKCPRCGQDRGERWQATLATVPNENSAN